MTLTKQRSRRPTVHQQKLRGAHHKRNEHYIKAYWPYLPVFAVLGLGIVLNTFIGQASHSVLGYSTDVSAKVLLADTNAFRSTKGEPALELNENLAQAAQAKANDMVKRNYWSHVTPDGTQPWAFMDKAGYAFEAAGENLAYGFGTSDDIVTAWMQSPEHRANILNKDYRDVGFATANASNFQGHGPETIIVAMYGEPTNLNASPSASGAVIQTAASQQFSRLQVVTSATWVQLSLAALCGAAITLFFLRHAFAWHKVLTRGEKFAIAHPFFDMFLLALVVFAFLMSHAAGTIL
ncbi:MAG TPA: CAP domain-containing protein [Candidatus Saccharimonadales bacterium]|nr:CAP domain-containing protein [Candidatus Saccharimonadales bacterium]